MRPLSRWSPDPVLLAVVHAWELEKSRAPSMSALYRLLDVSDDDKAT